MDETMPRNIATFAEKVTERANTTDPATEDHPSNVSSLSLDKQKIQDVVLNPEAKMVVIQRTLTIPIQWPYKLDFLRVHPDPSWIITVATIEWEYRHYVLVPELYQLYQSEAVIKRLVPAITATGKLFLWPIKENLSGRFNPKVDIVHKAVKLARKEWIRIATNRLTRDYTVVVAKGLPEPDWPEDISTQEDLYRIALADVAITSREHPVIRSLEGEMVYSQGYLDS